MTLHVITGPVRSEKSTTLLWYINRALRSHKRVSVAVPEMDVRNNGTISTHSGRSLMGIEGVETFVVPSVVMGGKECASSEAWAKSLSDVDLHVVDEGQFFDPLFPDTLGTCLPRIPDIVIAGLDMDSDGRPFGPIPHLLAMADHVKKITAICACGKEASRTVCKVKKTQQVLVGGEDLYEPACFSCWFRQHSFQGVRPA